jgi:hypothetical protein
MLSLDKHELVQKSRRCWWVVSYVHYNTLLFIQFLIHPVYLIPYSSCLFSSLFVLFIQFLIHPVYSITYSSCLFNSVFIVYSIPYSSCLFSSLFILFIQFLSHPVYSIPYSSCLRWLAVDYRFALWKTAFTWLEVTLASAHNLDSRAVVMG